MHSILVAATFAIVSSASATDQIELTINPALSHADFNLCAIGSCDTDSSPIAGSIVIDLDSPVIPAQMNLYDFVFSLTENLVFDLAVPFGAVHVTANDIDLYYPAPGQPFGPAAVTAGHFTLLDVPALAAGDANYNATGLACVLIQAAGLPCVNQISLSSVGEVSADSIMGTIMIVGNQLTLVINAAISIPILPDNPDLAQLDFMGSIVATGVLPMAVPGDFDGDGDADIFDYGAFVACESGPDGGIIIEPCRALDFDGDDDVDLPDFGAFQLAFTGP